MNARLVAGIALIAVGVIGLWLVATRAWTGAPAWRDFASNGEQLYYTGVSRRTGPVPFRGGPMWLRMHGGGCVACHGVDGRGGAQVMALPRTPPDIRYSQLTRADHEGHGEGEHPPYTDALIARAVVEGLDPGGRVLDWTMPRWQLSAADLDDLLAYLKTLR